MVLMGFVDDGYGVEMARVSQRVEKERRGGGRGQGEERKVFEAISQSRLPGSRIPFMVLKSVISYKGDGSIAL
jgi:hypothetical protein